VVCDIRTLFNLAKSLDSSSEIKSWNIPEIQRKGGVKKVFGWNDRSDHWKKFDLSLTDDVSVVS
jgi:hypothetical protein